MFVVSVSLSLFRVTLVYQHSVNVSIALISWMGSFARGKALIK